MNDEELNKAIHKWMGRGCYHDLYYKPHELGGSTLECKNGCPVSLFEKNPDYCQDHTAVREFLDYMEAHEMEWWEMVWALYGASESSLFTFPEAVKLAVKLSPRQLAEAGAKAVGIWEGE